MFRLSDAQSDEMKMQIAWLRMEGDDAMAEAWLLWAEVYLHTLEIPVPAASTKKIFPLVYVLSEQTGADPKQVQVALHDLLTPILFQAKLNGRDLNLDDGHKAIKLVRSGLKPADG